MTNLIFKIFNNKYDIHIYDSFAIIECLNKNIFVCNVTTYNIAKNHTEHRKNCLILKNPNVTIYIHINLIKTKLRSNILKKLYE